MTTITGNPQTPPDSSASPCLQILRKGLDTDMPDLLESESRADLKGKLAAAFGQGDD